MPRRINLPLNLIASILTGIFLGLSFPPFNFRALAWAALIPFLLSTPASGRKAFGSGILAGLIANGFIFIWIWKTFQAAHQPFLITLSSWLLLSLLFSFYVGIFRWVYFIWGPSLWRPWAAAGLWVLLDFLKSILFSGFPWALISQTQVIYLSLAQIACVTGAEGVTFLVLLGNTSISEFLLSIDPSLESRKKTPVFKLSLRTWIPFLILISLTLTWGEWRLKESLLWPKQNLRVGLLQPNIDQYQKWDSSYEESIRRTYEELVLKITKARPSVIVWPESGVPGWLPNDKKYVDWLHSVVAPTEIFHIVGAVTRRGAKDYNAAFLVDPQGIIVDEYDKHHLVPFGEYVPMNNVLGKFVPYLGELGTFDEGEGPAIFFVANVRYAPSICYESIFPGLIRQHVNAGGQVLVNITNDGWYLNTGAPEQHYVVNIYRAIENERPVIRAANTGISGVIDAYGRQILRTPLLKKNAYIVDLPVHITEGRTLYTAWGPWFLFVCLGLVAFLSLRRMYQFAATFSEPVKKN